MNRTRDRLDAARRALVAALALLCLVPTSYAAERIEDETLHFTLSLPDGFKRHPVPVGAAPDIVHAFIRGDPNDEEPDIFIYVKRMHGVLGRERLDPQDLPLDFEGTLMSVKWPPFELNCFEIPEKILGVMYVTYNVQVPLKYEAIQLSLVGPIDRKAELLALLPNVLAGLEGESNWTLSVSKSSTGVPKWHTPVYVAVAIVIVLGGSVVLWLVSKKSPILVLSILIFAASWIWDDTQTSEAYLLSGCLRLLGILGVIFHFLRTPQRRIHKERTANKPDAGAA